MPVGADQVVLHIHKMLAVYDALGRQVVALPDPLLNELLVLMLRAEGIDI